MKTEDFANIAWAFTPSMQRWRDFLEKLLHRTNFQPLRDNISYRDADLPLNWIEKSGSDQQKIGIWGKKSGSWSNRLQKEITHPKSQLFVVSFFYSAIRNVLNCQSSSYVFFSCLFCLCMCCFCFYVCSLRPASSWLSFLTLVREYSSRNFWVIFCYFAGGGGVMNPDKIKICSI